MSWFGQFFANQSDDVGLLGCELTVGSRLALAGRPARGLQFPGGALGECLRSHQAEYVVGGAQAVARVNSSALAAQPRTVEQVAASQFPANLRCLRRAVCGWPVVLLRRVGRGGDRWPHPVHLIQNEMNRLRRRQRVKPNLDQLEVTARLFGPVFFRAVRKVRRQSAMACTPVMVRGMSSGDRTSMKMAMALTLDMVHSHFCTRQSESVWALGDSA
jgi:hypothetical protein